MSDILPFEVFVVLWISICLIGFVVLANRSGRK